VESCDHLALMVVAAGLAPATILLAPLTLAAGARVRRYKCAGQRGAGGAV
jgi:hypothetical protein